MNLIYNECDEGFYVCEDPRDTTIPIDVRVGRGSTLEEAKADYFKKCRKYADDLRSKYIDIYIATQDWIPHNMRHER